MGRTDKMGSYYWLKITDTFWHLRNAKTDNIVVAMYRRIDLPDVITVEAYNQNCCRQRTWKRRFVAIEEARKAVSVAYKVCKDSPVRVRDHVMVPRDIVPLETCDCDEIGIEQKSW